MAKERISDALIEAFEEGFENIARRYSRGSGTKAKLLLVRKVLGLSQKEFADEFGIPFATVRNWEQPDRAEPTGAAKTLIDLIAEDPKAVRHMLRKARTPQEKKAGELANAE
jgi:DNA-binding transcriptional regulator YiaG